MISFDETEEQFTKKLQEVVTQWIYLRRIDRKTTMVGSARACLLHCIALMGTGELGIFPVRRATAILVRCKTLLVI